MAGGSSVNSQVVDATTQVGTGVLGHAAALSLALVEDAMADSLGLAMQNAVSAQHNGQVVATASVAATCALILTLGGASSD